MPTYQIIDEPLSHFQSVYSPIKYSARASTTNRDAYVSSKVTITPYDNITDAALTDQKVSIRVQPSIDIPNYNSSGNTPNNDYLYYVIDVSSICRDFLSYSLRPCTHDTGSLVRRDITLAEISNNVYQKFEVNFELEVISSGALVLSGESETSTFYATNTALLHEQEHYLNIAEHLYDGSTGNLDYGGDLVYQYVHTGYSNYLKNRQKYLTTKPTNHRIIGHDECEYLSFLHKDDGTNDVRVLVRFYDKNGSSIENGLGQIYTLVINKTVDGNGNTGSNLNSWADSGSTAEDYSVCQVGIGTRNIKESPDDRFNDSCAVTDFSNIGYYEVYTEYFGSDKIGETVRYYIDHTRQRVNGVRFHWQNRLGGIDSYTFDGAFTEGINISSKTYEQSIYPDFRGQLGASAGGRNMITGDNPLYEEDYGALVPRVAGLTDDKYPSVRKSKVKAVKEGTAISRPYGVAEQDMFEDLLASPNVWIEKGWIGKEVFREDWSGYSAVSNITDNWNQVEGSFTTDAAFSTSDGHITGTRTYKKGDNSGNDTIWASSKKFIKYNPKSIYEIEVRIKSSGSGSGNDLVGFTGYAADKTTKISTGGSDTFNSAHYITLKLYDQTANDKFETFRGYVTGHSTTAAVQSNNINDPSTAYNGIEYISPMFLLHHDDVEGITQIDYIVVREYQTDIPNSRGWYSTLNRNYYVPVVVKDASVTTFDNENLQRCTLNYIESKAKRTIE
jgi:hypothetical protein